MGTLLRIRVQTPEAEIDRVLTAAFGLVEDLESKFSKFNAASDTTRLNQSDQEICVSSEFSQLAELALELWQDSAGAFNPFSNLAFTSSKAPLVLRGQNMRRALPVCVDFSGIAKGFVVDQICAFLARENWSGVVNAGGDLRFFGAAIEPRPVEVRLPGNLLLSLHIQHESFATSSYQESLSNPLSTTSYGLPPRAGLTTDHTVCALAPTCALADALTKVGWFATADAARTCAEKYRARILVLDQLGNICQEFGGHEINPAL